MKEWICREMSTSTSGNENGVLMMETELIRCRNCENHGTRTNMCDIWHRHTNADGFCHRAKAKSKEQNAKCKGGEEE